MKRYMPRGLWYLGIVLVLLSILYFPTRFLVSGYLGVALLYLPLSIFFAITGGLMAGRGEISEFMLGARTSVVSLAMIVLGMAFCIIYAVIDSIYLAQFGAMSVLIGMDLALILRERRYGGKPADGSP